MTFYFTAFTTLVTLPLASTCQEEKEEKESVSLCFKTESLFPLADSKVKSACSCHKLPYRYPGPILVGPSEILTPFRWMLIFINNWTSLQIQSSSPLGWCLLGPGTQDITYVHFSCLLPTWGQVLHLLKKVEKKQSTSLVTFWLAWHHFLPHWAVAL